MTRLIYPPKKRRHAPADDATKRKWAIESLRRAGGALIHVSAPGRRGWFNARGEPIAAPRGADALLMMAIRGEIVMQSDRRETHYFTHDFGKKTTKETPMSKNVAEALSDAPTVAIKLYPETIATINALAKERGWTPEQAAERLCTTGWNRLAALQNHASGHSDKRRAAPGRKARKAKSAK